MERAHLHASREGMTSSRGSSRSLSGVDDAIVQMHKGTTRVLLEGLHVSDTDVERLCARLQSNRTVTLLNLSGNALSDAACTHLKRCLARNRTLNFLNLESNELIADEGAVAIAEQLQQSQTLWALYLAHTKIADRGAVALARMLAINRTLRVLSLCGLSDDAAVVLASSLRVNKSLTTLSLSSHTVTEAGTAALETALEGNFTLCTFSGLQTKKLLDYLGRNRVMQQTLRQAIESGDVDVMAGLIQRGAYCGNPNMTAFHAALDAKRFAPVMFLLSTRCFDLDLWWSPLKRRSAFEDIVAALPDAPDLVRKKIRRQLVKVFPWEEMWAWAAEVQKTWDAARKDVLYWEQRKNAVDAAVSQIRMDDTLELLKQLGQVEANVVASNIDNDERAKRIEARRVAREAAVSELKRASLAAAQALAFMEPELKALRAEGAKEKALEPVATAIVEKTQKKFDAFAELIRELQASRDLVTVYAAGNENGRRRDLQAQIDAVSGKLFSGVLQLRAQAPKLGPLMKKASPFMAGTLRMVAARMLRDQGDCLEFLELVRQKYQEVEAALEAEPRVANVVAAMEASQKELEKAKRKLKIAELQAEDEEGVADALDKLNVARQLVVDARRVYEDAVRAVMEIRQLGFPEVKCKAAAKTERFPNVPEISFDEMELGPLVGHGQFSDVFECTLPVTGRCAFKQLRGATREELLKEAAAMWEVRNCGYVLQLHKVCVGDAQGNRMGLVVEFMDGGSLATRLQKQARALTKNECLRLMCDLLRGLEAIHESNHVHLDVKSDNILLTERGHAKLGDFGTSRAQRETVRATGAFGTLRWSAPELFETPQRISAACDIWSAGMVMWEMVVGHGRAPFHELDDTAALRAIASGETPSLECVDEDLADVMRRCWLRDPTARPTAKELAAIVERNLTCACGICLQNCAAEKGLLCSDTEGQHFRCVGCLEDEMRAPDLKAEADGSLLCGANGCVGRFELHRTREVVGVSAFESLQRAVWKAKEVQLASSFRDELARERRRWEVEDRSARVLREVELALSVTCPGCGAAFELIGGCAAIQHKDCGARFCGFCWLRFLPHEGRECHEHANRCPRNQYGTIFVTLQQWDEAQRVRIRAAVQDIVARLSDEDRRAVEPKIQALMKG